MFDFLKSKKEVKPKREEEDLPISPPIDKLLKLFKDNPDRLTINRIHDSQYSSSVDINVEDTVTSKSFKYHVSYGVYGAAMFTMLCPQFLNKREVEELCGLFEAIRAHRFQEKNRKAAELRKRKQDRERQKWIEAYINE